MATQNYKRFAWILLICTVFYLNSIESAKEKEAAKKINAQKINKDVKDYSDTDIYHLLDQWNENDDEFDPSEEEDDPRLKVAPKIQFDPKLMATDPQAMLKLAKKGKQLMMFATVAGKPSKKETETISSLWQTSLHNAQIQLQRYVVSDNRVLFSLEDGSKAWDVKDFLVERKDCEVVEFENQKFPCKGANSESKTEL